MSPAASLFQSWIDTPLADPPASPRLFLYGWCFHREGQAIGGVRARLGRRVCPGRHGRPRPDVSAAFNAAPGSATSGFEIALVLPPRPALCLLEAQLADGSWHEVRQIDLPAAPRLRWRDRVRWGKFWLEAWLGRPAGWARLAPDEQRFMLAWAEHRGWLNIGVFDQHAPRPVAPERFPAPRRSAAQLPKVTIVTPSFNQGAFLEATLRSVLDQQPGVRLDYIVQDGGSTDDSADLLRRYGPRLKHCASAPDAGQADAIARGFTHAECGPDDIMAYLNSDDCLMPGAVAFVAEYFARHPAVDVVYGHRVLIDDDGAEIGRWITPRRACDDLRLQDLVPQETLFWRRRIWDRVGGIDPSFHFAVDWDLLLRFAAAGARIARLPWFLGQFRLHPQQKTQAWMERHGIPEMDKLRARSLGHMPTAAELETSMRRAQFDSALVCALLQRGWRV